MIINNKLIHVEVIILRGYYWITAITKAGFTIFVTINIIVVVIVEVIIFIIIIIKKTIITIKVKVAIVIKV